LPLKARNPLSQRTARPVVTMRLHKLIIRKSKKVLQVLTSGVSRRLFCTDHGKIECELKVNVCVKKYFEQKNLNQSDFPLILVNNSFMS
jgi:hypothetical protein